MGGVDGTGGRHAGFVVMEIGRSWVRVLVG